MQIARYVVLTTTVRSPYDLPVPNSTNITTISTIHNAPSCTRALTLLFLLLAPVLVSTVGIECLLHLPLLLHWVVTPLPLHCLNRQRQESARICPQRGEERVWSGNDASSHPSLHN
jgi:hypothetical protein